MKHVYIDQRDDDSGKTGSSKESLTEVYDSTLHKDRKSEESGLKREWQKNKKISSKYK